MLIRIIVLFALILITTVVGNMMTMYKKNEQNIYEPDLVAVSSTVIPETEIKSEALTDIMDMQYKRAFVKLFGKKKYNEKFHEKPDTLITDKKKFDKKAK